MCWAMISFYIFIYNPYANFQGQCLHPYFTEEETLVLRGKSVAQAHVAGMQIWVFLVPEFSLPPQVSDPKRILTAR